MAEMTQEEVLKRIEGLDEEQQKSVVCALVGHSRIKDACFGYITCARCDAQVGDTLGGSYKADGDVIVDHNCKTCRENTKKLTWKDTLLAPAEPLKES